MFSAPRLASIFFEPILVVRLSEEDGQALPKFYVFLHHTLHIFLLKLPFSVLRAGKRRTQSRQSGMSLAVSFTRLFLPDFSFLRKSKMYCVDWWWSLVYLKKLRLMLLERWGTTRRGSKYSMFEFSIICFFLLPAFAYSSSSKNLLQLFLNNVFVFVIKMSQISQLSALLWTAYYFLLAALNKNGKGTTKEWEFFWRKSTKSTAHSKKHTRRRRVGNTLLKTAWNDLSINITTPADTLHQLEVRSFWYQPECALHLKETRDRGKRKDGGTWLLTIHVSLWPLTIWLPC